MDKIAVMEAAFLDELASIEKEAGIGGFLRGGLKGWGNVLSGGGAVAAGRARAGGLLGHIGQIYRSGAQQLGERAVLNPAGTHAMMMGARSGGVLGGLGALARSRYGQMAAIPVLGAGAYLAGRKLLGGGQQQQQPQQQGYY